MKLWKKYYKTLYSNIFIKNAELFNEYNYTYTGSLVLFWTMPYWKKIPEDVDVALDRNGKGINELLAFYHKLKNHPLIEQSIMKTVFGTKYTIDNQEIEVQKHEKIDLQNINQKLLERLLENGNIRISYNILWVTTEVFPEKNGNGLTNLGIMNKEIVYIKIKEKKQMFHIPMLGYKALAQGYAMNFLKEIIQNNIYRFTDQNNKVKDGMRLFNIISLLDRQWEDASPEWVLKFITSTVNEYKKIPEQYRSTYINSAIKEFPRIKKMFKEIIKEFRAIMKKKDSKKYEFTSFYKKLWTYKKELHQYIDYLEKDMLTMLKKEILWEKYTIIDAVKSFSQQKKIYNNEELKTIAKNLKRITKGIEKIWIKNRKESFAYFYEMYMLKNLFITPIKKIL